MTTIAEKIFRDLQAISLLPNDKAAAFLTYCKDNLGMIEKLNFDYKEKQDSANSILSDIDKRNLAKAVSGFANSGGGVLIWGIEDATINPKPIMQITEFARSIQLLAATSTDPIVPKIDSGYISDDNVSGFAYIFIPESDFVPHRVILNIRDVKDHYYIRTGETFPIASHIMLEDMFGRRPKPQLSLLIKLLKPGKKDYFINGTIIIGITNSGRGVAKSPYLAISFNQYYSIGRYGIDGNGRWGLDPLPKVLDDDYFRYGSSGNVVIHSGVEYPITSIEYHIDMREGIEHKPDLIIKYQIGAEGIPLIKSETKITMQTILDQFDK